jgi:hypothetical protein
MRKSTAWTRRRSGGAREADLNAEGCAMSVYRVDDRRANLDSVLAGLAAATDRADKLDFVLLPEAALEAETSLGRVEGRIPAVAVRDLFGVAHHNHRVEEGGYDPGSTAWADRSSIVRGNEGWTAIDAREPIAALRVLMSSPHRPLIR